MILHTIACKDMIFTPDDSSNYIFKKDGNRFIQCVNSNNQNTICRLISTDPKDYLNPKYNIGEKY